MPVHNARSLATACVIAYVAAGLAIIVTLFPLLPADPHTLAIAHALRVALIALVLLPPAAPTIVAATIWLVAKRHGHTGAVDSWLTLGILPYTIERIAQAAWVVTAPPPPSAGAWLDRPTQITFGPGLVFRLLGIHLAPDAAYWWDVCTITAAASMYCWSRALAELLAARRGVGYEADGLDRRSALTTVASGYLLATYLVWRSAPAAMLGFLRVVG